MRHSLILLLLLLPAFYPLQAQSYIPEKINSKAQKAYNDAMLQLRDGFIPDAIPLLQKAIDYAPGYIDAYLSLAGVYGEMKNYEKSTAFLPKSPKPRHRLF